MRLALTVKEAADALGISTSTVYWMVYYNEIPHQRVKSRGCNGQGKILIPVKEVEKWLQKGGA